MRYLTMTTLDVHLQHGSLPCISIGRAPGNLNDIIYHDRKVSRVHCKIGIREDGACAIFDMGSRSGTYLNDIRIPDTARGFAIARGDVIALRSPKKPHHVIRINSILISHPDDVPMSRVPQTILQHRARFPSEASAVPVPFGLPPF